MRSCNSHIFLYRSRCHPDSQDFQAHAHAILLGHIYDMENTLSRDRIIQEVQAEIARLQQVLTLLSEVTEKLAAQQAKKRRIAANFMSD